MCTHPAFPDQRENPPVEGWDAGAAFLCDVCTDWVIQIWSQKGSSKHFWGCSFDPRGANPGGEWEGSSFQHHPQNTARDCGGNTGCSLFLGSTSHSSKQDKPRNKVCSQLMTRTRCMLFRISYFFGLLVSLNQKRLWVQWLEINWIYLPSRYLSSDLAVTEILQNAVFCSTFQYETWGAMILWFQLSAREDSNYTPHNRSAVKLLCNYSVTKLYLIYLYSEVHLELAIRARTWLNTYLHQSQYI